MKCEERFDDLNVTKNISISELIFKLDLQHDPYVIITEYEQYYSRKMSGLPFNKKDRIGIIRDYFNPTRGSDIYTYDYLRNHLLNINNESIECDILLFHSKETHNVTIKYNDHDKTIEFINYFNITKMKHSFYPAVSEMHNDNSMNSFYPDVNGMLNDNFMNLLHTTDTELVKFFQKKIYHDIV